MVRRRRHEEREEGMVRRRRDGEREGGMEREKEEWLGEVEKEGWRERRRDGERGGGMVRRCREGGMEREEEGWLGDIVYSVVAPVCLLQCPSIASCSVLSPHVAVGVSTQKSLLLHVLYDCSSLLSVEHTGCISVIGR